MEIIKDDAFGPELIVKVHDAKIGLDGFLVVDNTTLGPGKGGIRMTHNVSEEEVRRLARAMTWKNAIAGIPFGGGKSGIIWKGGTPEQKKALMQGFAKAIKPLLIKKYIAGPDVNTGELEMAQFVEASGIFNSATGKPANLCMKVFGKKGKKCGLPHEFGSTGFGVACSAKVAAEVLGINIKGATVSIHGFGNVGTFAYTFLTEMGAKVVAIADKDGAVFVENGFDEKIIKDIIKNKKPINSYSSGLPAGRQAKKLSAEEFWKVPVDILIPASVTDVINDSNKNDIKAKLIVEAGNIPMRENVEDELFKKGIMFVPDFVANAGGVISSYAEYKGLNSKKMFEIVESKIVKATKSVMTESLAKKVNPRMVAMDLAKKIILSKKNRN